MLSGIYVPNFTAFTRNGDLDLDATVAHAQWLLQSEISGLIPFGTFGEGASLSLTEMKIITAELVQAKGDKEVIPTLIMNSMASIKEFLDFLAGLNVQYAMVLPPSYFHPADVETMVKLFDQIINYTNINIIAYNIPACAVELPLDVVAQTNVWGVKDSSGDLESVKRYLATGKQLLVGSDKLLVPALAAGAAGGILGLANVFPQHFTTAWRHYQSGDVAAAQAQIDIVSNIVGQVVPAGSSFGETIGYIKSLAKQIAPIDLGYMRLPVKSQTAPKVNLN